MARELRILSLEAAAERHLGSSSGLSFAKLTQTILKRLTPDRADLVFGTSQGDDILGQIDWDAPPDFFHPLLMNYPAIAGFGPTLFGNMTLSNIIEPSGSLADLGLPSKPRADQLASFYFAHSHTLYPIINQSDFLALLDHIYEQPSDPSTMDPMSLFRLWMVLAIGSSSRCSVSMIEESEALLYYNKALEFFEPAFDYGDMVALETIVLQVSFSFFNQLGPNTWFLVGTAARMALGMGLHTASAYENLPFNIANLRKRIFFSIYMMDRVPHLSSNWYDFNYYTHLAMLYRPSPLFPTLDQVMVKKLANAASMSIHQAYAMHRQKRFAYNWLNLLSLFTATISLIYASTVQPQALVSYLQQAQVIDDLELVLQLFDKLNGKFSGAKNIQCIIDRVLRRYKEMCNTASAS
ncbi:putative c6 zinc finger domain containing protein [Eutypa lata UCREL1]|uniref:Putative c6 zinc finger domain containing protein n=1 Tax=Eutypa lata (strain UCR-EL1) TaxID=1287681 RepID=M7T223_EUTLA|nr:putative c6 zinc finger domain containing protein [Eutypa lata UCREL1]